MPDGWTWSGERSLLRRFDDPDARTASRAVHALRAELLGRAFPEIEDLVPGARSLLASLRPGAEPSAELLAAGSPEMPHPHPAHAVREIAVRYGGADGPDLLEVARRHGLREDEVVRLHAQPTYVVGFIGFSPGFPYLLGLPESLVTPRLDTPRTRVPGGSVAIGGAHTGIYPRATPGGWRLIGRADIDLFDPSRDPPAILSPGTSVRFIPT